jgi:DNA-directed RNA polymerase sigma subunit (sigma70/sigma32)
MYNQADYNRNQNSYQAKTHSSQFHVSLNKPIYDEDSDRTLLDVISGSKITDPEELIISREELTT